MNNAIKKNASKILILSLTLFAATGLSSINVKAAESNSYDVSYRYMADFAESAAGLADNDMATADITITLSTEELEEGTVVTVSGIPTDCINFQANDNYTVDFAEDDVETKTYGGWYGGEKYNDGTIQYTLKTDANNLTLTFGKWILQGEAGFDASYIISEK